jgi:hypothetical protein
MAYVSRMIGHNETLIGISRLHWINIVQGLFWLAGLMVAGAAVQYLMARYLGAYAPLAPWAVVYFKPTWIDIFCVAAGLYIFSIYFLNYLTSEIALTSQRVIHKQGLFFIKIEEMNLEEVKGARIDTGYLGWLFGYGAVMLDARLVRDVKLPFINKPYRFIAALGDVQEKLEDHLSLVIENGKNTGKARLRHAKEISTENAQKICEELSEDMPPTLVEEGQTPARPQRAAHQVAEGSYEEEKLKEEFAQEWDDHSEGKTGGSSDRTVH